jgi:hypothetical protein
MKPVSKSAKAITGAFQKNMTKKYSGAKQLPAPPPGKKTPGKKMSGAKRKGSKP